MVLAWSALCSPASAQLREHGAFTVVRDGTTKDQNCKLIIKYSAGGKSFNLSIAKYAALDLAVVYSSDLDHLLGKEAFLEIDRKMILRLYGNVASLPGPMVTIHAQKDADRQVQWMLSRAEDAHQLEIVAGDFRWPIPVDGFKQAVGDDVGCLDGRWM